MIYKVRVRGRGKSPPEKLGGRWKNARWLAVVLVEADTLDDAMVVGRDFAECQASPAYRWEEFYPLSATALLVPVQVEALL